MLSGSIENNAVRVFIINNSSFTSSFQVGHREIFNTIMSIQRNARSGLHGHKYLVHVVKEQANFCYLILCTYSGRLYSRPSLYY